jgi:predicted RNA-binding protein with TRAM domain
MSYSGRGYGGGGGYRSQRGFGGPKPVEVGKEYDVQISELSRQGDGITRIQGFVIFVKGTRVGESAKIRITKVGERFATAEKVGASTGQQPQEQKETTSSEPKQVAPPVSEEEKPELQDYKSEEHPPTG